MVRRIRPGKTTRPTRTLPQAGTFSSAEADSGGGVAVATPVSQVSLEEVHGTVEVPHYQAGFWQQLRAFSGPAVLVSVGYMDPGNWGTDLQGGAQFKYGLLWVVGLASLMAIFMQVISARLGVVTGKDLAQCCRDWYLRSWLDGLKGDRNYIFKGAKQASKVTDFLLAFTKKPEPEAVGAAQ